MAFLVGVAGGSGSGKTTLARALGEGFPARDVQVIALDCYYKDRKGLSIEDKATINYDHPEAFDAPLLLEHLRALKAGRAIEQPTYDYALHERAAEVVAVEPSRVVILEGILVLAFPELVPLLDLKIFVDTAPDLRVLRRLRRDLVERGRTVDSVIEQYVDTVRPMHNAFVEPTRYQADIIVPAGRQNAEAVAMLRAWLAAVVRD